MFRKLFTSFVITIFILLTLIYSRSVRAASDYEITSFKSTINLQENTDLIITEEIDTVFNIYKHGIFRIIPLTYSAHGRTINANLSLLSVTDDSGAKVQVEKSKLGRSVELKIGDPNRTIIGNKTYVLNYRLSDVVQQFSDYDEVYWNVTGSEWDTNINNATVEFVSEFADIENSVCFAGPVGSDQSNCTISNGSGKVNVTSDTDLGYGKDFTVAFALDKNNQLLFPTKTDKLIKTLKDNWDYIPAILPLFIMVFIWFKKGRDKRFASDAVYYEPENKKVKDKSPFVREHIPLMYHPIDNLTPAQVGTLIDEKVDIEDIIAEIMELARLGYIKVVKINDKTLLRKAEYSFLKLKDSTKGLNDYQSYLFREIFRKDYVLKSFNEAEKLFEKDKVKRAEVRKQMFDYKYVLLSTLEKDFYKYLDGFKKKLYASLSTDYFDGNPDLVRKKWMGIFIGLMILSIMSRSIFISTTGNFGPMILTFLTVVPGVMISYFMPRKTAKGYMYARQAEGLKFYLRKGDWRYKVQEKDLFVEEILPLAISLGVVNKLAKDMGKLGLNPPDYTYGFSPTAFSTDFRNFSSTTSSSLMTTPGSKYSGSGSWSGGSGFSGGSSGGGFGGGGGGSW